MAIQRKILFYDIETSFCEGWFWRPGYNQRITPDQIISYAKIISISWKWYGKDEVHHLDWGINKQCDKKLVKKFIKELNKADEIAAHNGDRFDLRWIRTRAAYHNIEMRPDYNSIDTLKLCKKYLNLPSNTLAEAAKYFGLEAKKDSGGLDTWRKIIFDKDQKALDTMHHYCDGDVITLEELYLKLRPYVKVSGNYAVLRGGHKFNCPFCGSVRVWKNKTMTTAAGTFKHYMKCANEDCRTPFQVNNKTNQDWLQFKMMNGLK